MKTQKKEKDLQQQYKALRAVYEVGRRLSQTLDLDEVCWVIYREIAQALWQAPHLSIALFDEATEMISGGFLIVDGEEMDASLLPQMALGEGPVSDTIRTRQPRMLDLQAAVKQLQAQGRAVHVGDERQALSALFVPMVSDDRVVGVMGVQHYDADAFVDTDMELLSTLASQAAAALVNAQLYDRVQMQLTAVQKTQQTLQATETFLQSILSSVQEGIVVTDQEFIIHYWNRYMEALTGIETTAVLGKSLLQVCDQIYEQYPDEITVSSQSGVVTQIPEVAFNFRDGGQKGWLSLTHCPRWDDAGNMVGLIITFKDITRQRAAEDAISQAQKMESLGVLAGGMAHDFNNLLAAILAQSELAELKLVAQHPAREHVSRSVAAAHQAADLISQLLTYTGQQLVQLQPVDINQVIEDNFHVLQTAVSNNITLTFQPGHNIPLINADASQLKRIVLNLVLNGAEAIGESDGTVSIHTAFTLLEIADLESDWHHRVGTLLPGEYVLLEITDDGSGMDAETIKRIFDPFFSTKFTGRGLGLATVQGVVRNHFGGIFVRSTPGKGSTLRVYFPPVKTAVRPSGFVPLRQTTKANAMVLVIDDDKTVCNAVADILALEAIRTVTAVSGPKGLALFRQHQHEIKVVLLDHSMPGMSGTETLEALLNMDPHVKVLLTSGYAREQLKDEISDDTIVGFIQKPYDINELLAAIQAFTHKEEDE